MNYMPDEVTERMKMHSNGVVANGNSYQNGTMMHGSANDDDDDDDEHHTLLAEQREGDHGSSETTTTTESSSSSRMNTVLMGRILLLGVAFLYGTLAVVLRWVYSLDGPPTAPALSTTRGWLAVLCFAPFLATMKTTATTTTSATTKTTHSQPEGGEVENARIPTTTDERMPLTLASSASSAATATTTATARPSLTRIALELAIWNFGAQGLINAGLITCPSARASFLTQSSVVMTPVLSRCCGYTIKAQVWMSCMICLSGLILLSYAKHAPETENDSSNTSALAAAATATATAASTGFGWGDTLVLIGTLSWSIYIFRMSAIGQYGYNETMVQAQKNLFLAVLYTIWWIAQTLWSSSSSSGDDDDAHHNTHTGAWMYNPLAWLLLLYSAAGPGTLADVVQQKGQVSVPAAESNVILSTEPVFTTILGRILLGETTSWLEKGGGLLILAAAVVASYP